MIYQVLIYLIFPQFFQPDFLTNHNDQSLVEICITRLTSAIRETRSIERHAEPLVNLLETCLTYNLRPISGGPDPPHAKIASDVMSCIFLVSIQREQNDWIWQFVFIGYYISYSCLKIERINFYSMLFAELRQEKCDAFSVAYIRQISTQRQSRLIKEHGLISIIGSDRKCGFVGAAHTTNHRFGHLR